MLHLSGGDIVFQNLTLDVDNTTYAVTGGTGAYVCAVGTVASRAPRGTTTATVTVTLR